MRSLAQVCFRNTQVAVRWRFMHLAIFAALLLWCEPPVPATSPAATPIPTVTPASTTPPITPVLAPPLAPPLAPTDTPVPASTTTADTQSTDKPTTEKMSIDAPVAEVHKRAYIIIDRFTTAAGVIESETDEVIVLRDGKARVRSFAKARVISVCYLLEGPEGRRVRAVFNDGRVIVASLIEDGYEEVTLEIDGIRTKYARAAVNEVRAYPTDKELYLRFRASIEPDQYAARFTMAFWLYNKKMYVEAKTELESLLEATNHFEAKKLLVEINAQLALMTPLEEPAENIERVDSDDPSGAPGLRDQLPSKLLTDSEVNLIRVYELDLSDPPRMQIPESTIRKMLEKYADSALIPSQTSEKTAFFSKDPAELVRTLFALKARELYGEVEVLGEPRGLNTFRQRVHNACLIGNCATSRCHGGADAGRLFLHNRNAKDDNVRYTNLLILLRTSIDTLPLIDFDKPTDSLIYQYALPRSEARRPHPDVRGWEPVLHRNRRSLQEDFIDWVRSMRVPAGGYPIEYEPPALKSPDQVDQTGPDR